MSELKKQANESPKPITPSTNSSWLKLTQRIAQTELQLKGGNLTPAQVTQFESQLNRDRLKLVEVEASINNVNTLPTTSAQDRREQDLNRREGQVRAGENALLEREQALLAKEKHLLDLQADLERREESLNSREQHYRERMMMEPCVAATPRSEAELTALAGGVPASGQSISDIV